jgi:hypothetical protein
VEIGLGRINFSEAKYNYFQTLYEAKISGSSKLILDLSIFLILLSYDGKLLSQDIILKPRDINRLIRGREVKDLATGKRKLAT